MEPLEVSLIAENAVSLDMKDIEENLASGKSQKLPFGPDEGHSSM